jgi:hypothetical protein
MRNAAYVLAVLTLGLVPGVLLADLDDGLVAYYPFSGNANDLSGHGHHAEVFGCTLTTDRYDGPNSAYFFDGVDDYMNVLDSDMLSGGSGKSFTWSVWINTQIVPEPPVGRKIVAKFKDDAYKDWGIILGEHPLEPGFVSVRFGYENGHGNQGPTLISSQLMTVNEWYHVAVTLNGSNRNAAMYVDGEPQDTVVLNYDLPDTDAPVKIGKQEYELHGQWGYFHGKIDDIRIYSRVISEDEIQCLAGILTGVGDTPNTDLTLTQSYPSPFSSTTRIGYRIQHSGHVRLTVYDATGRVVRELVDDAKGRGEYSVEWVGLDDNGQKAPAGVYFIRLLATEQVVAKKIVLVR